MDLKTFKTQLQILNETERREFRKKYIEKFINTHHESYQKQIQSKRKFLDGYCYLGYLWDYVKNPSIIDIEYIEKIAKNIDAVYVFWDIHSCERIFVQNYWKFDKDADVYKRQGIRRGTSRYSRNLDDRRKGNKIVWQK